MYINHNIRIIFGHEELPDQDTAEVDKEVPGKTTRILREEHPDTLSAMKNLTPGD
jgi:hypothetical protein